MELEEILEQVRAGRLDPGAAAQLLRNGPVADLDYAKLDLGRIARKGFPETILCAGKDPEHLVGIVGRMRAADQPVLATRADETARTAIRAAFPEARLYPQARLVVVGENRKLLDAPPVVVLSAGTSDHPVAEEAALTCEFLGGPVERIYDAGVAGLDRLLGRVGVLRGAAAIIVVAGMDGALPSVTAGLVDCPVLGVPTSTGYGAALGGLSALMAMLNSCAPGLSVLNIDNGHGAACQAFLIQRAYVNARSTQNGAAASKGRSS